jgi:hypothetical protein
LGIVWVDRWKKRATEADLNLLLGKLRKLHALRTNNAREIYILKTNVELKECNSI